MPYLHETAFRCDQFVNKEYGNWTHNHAGEDPADGLGVAGVGHALRYLWRLVGDHAVQEQ